MPKSVYMFLWFLMGGQSIFEAGEAEEGEEEEEATEDSDVEVCDDKKLESYK